MKKSIFILWLVQAISIFSFSQQKQNIQQPAASLKTAVNCDDEQFFINVYSNPTYDTYLTKAIDAGNGSYITVGSVIKKTATDGDAVIAKFDAAGIKLWEVMIAAPQGESFRTITRLKDGNFIAFASNPTINNDYFLLKISTNGTVLWKRDYSIPNQNLASEPKVEEDNDGSLIVTSRFLENGLSFNDRIYFCKLDATGNILLSKMFHLSAGRSNALYSRDLLVKNGYSFIIGMYYDIFQIVNFEGILMKVNNSNGNIEWTKHYDFNGDDTDFLQILSYNDSTLCITGKKDVNANDTSFVMLCDTMGKISSLNYFSYNAKAAGGTACLDNAGNLLWTQRNLSTPSSPKLDLIHLNPLKGILWAKTYSQLITNMRASTIFYSKDSSIMLGDQYNVNFSPGKYFLSKFSKSGDLGCPADPLTINFGPGNSTAENENFISRNISTVEVAAIQPIISNFIILEETVCAQKSTCTSLDITAPDKLCHVGDTLLVSITKNMECLSIPDLIFDNSFFRLIDISNTTARFKTLRPGTSKIKAAFNSTCSIIEDEVSIQVIDNPVKLYLGPDTTICSQTEIILKADLRFRSFLWQDNSTGSSITIKNGGTYFLEATDSCGNILRDTVVVNENPSIPISLGPDLSICSNDSIKITAPAGFQHYSWSNNYNINTTTGASVIVFPITDTSYTVIAEKTPGCYAYDTIRVKVNQASPIALRADTSICSGDSILLRANPGFVQYKWNTGDISQQISAKNQGTYTVIATNANLCISKDSFKIEKVFNPASVHLSKDPWICANSPRTLNAGSGFVKYNWNTGSNFPAISVTAAGAYWVDVTDINGCSDSDTTFITEIKKAPVNFLPDDTTLCNFGKLAIAASTKYNSYAWNTGSTTGSISITKAGVYTLQVQDQFGCSGIDSISISPIECFTGIFFPNAFTPNKDGNNDIFKPLVYAKTVVYKFSIYNRWGQKIFESTDPAKGWDGLWLGKLQDNAGFVWTCTYQLSGDVLKFEKGTVMLLR